MLFFIAAFEKGVFRQSSQQLYLFEWLPSEVAGLSATGGPFAVGIEPLLLLHQSQPLNLM